MSRKRSFAGWRGEEFSDKTKVHVSTEFVEGKRLQSDLDFVERGGQGR